MKSTVCCALLLVSAFRAMPIMPAQTTEQAVAPSTGPTMEQTIGFLQENLAKTGDVTTYWMAKAGRPLPTKNDPIVIHLEEPCALVLESQLLTVVHLDRTDPLSVTITTKEDLAHQNVYEILIGKAVYEHRPFPVQTTSPEVSEPIMQRDVLGHLSFHSGIVRSINGSKIVYQMGRGKVTEITTSPKDEVAIIPPYTVLGTYGEKYPGNMSDIAVGDEINVSPKYANGVLDERNGLDIDLYKNSPIPSIFTLATYLDNDLAQRVAKAMIHAIVLCHQPSKPSLF